MRDHQIIIKSYMLEAEADLDRGLLESAGIAAELEADDCGGMRPHFVLTGGIHLLVDREDEARAREVLAGEGQESGGEAWECPGCGESNEPGFEVCWSCQRDRPAA